MSRPTDADSAPAGIATSATPTDAPSVLSPDDIVHLRASWALMGATTDVIAPLFYDRLFRDAPAVRPLFARTEMPALGEKLAQTLTWLVHDLEQLGERLPALRALGAHHARLGVLPSHYPLVTQALLDTFADILQEHFTPPARGAWTRALALVGAIMGDAERDADSSALPAAPDDAGLRSHAPASRAGTGWSDSTR